MKRIFAIIILAFICLVNVNAQTDGSKRKTKQQVTVRSSSSPKHDTSTSPSQKSRDDKTKTSSPLTSSVSQSSSTSNVKAATYSEGHEYVDLGLSVKWATCNVGASSPSDYGGYYAWGETETKSIYNWSTYKWCNGSSTTMTRYSKSSSYGTVDNKTTLEPSDDVAHVKWGGDWRMPTRAEQDELRNTNNCTWTWTTQGGENGYKVTSKKNGNSIFLPAAGCRFEGSLYNASSGYYWSSLLYASDSNCAYSLYFYSGGVYSNHDLRNSGFAVRPVCP